MLLIVAVQTWVAIRWRSFTIAMGLGIGCTIVGIMLLRSLKNIDSTPYGPFLASLFPWSLPYVVLARQATTELRETALLAGILGGMLVAAVACWDVIHRDVR